MIPEDPEAPADFYSREYFLEGSAGAREYRDLEGLTLDHYKTRVLELTRLQMGETVLDLGCGRGEVVLACLNAGCPTWGLDFSTTAIELTRKTVKRHSPAALDRLHLVQSDACAANFPPASFDCVITTDFVEHVLQDRLVLVVQKVLSWLKPGGRFVVHTSPTLGYMYFGQFVARGLEILQGRRPERVETFGLQLRDGGHCNIQSVRTLRRLLRSFPELRVWAEFSAPGGSLKAMMDRTHLTPLLAHHLYATARKSG